MTTDLRDLHAAAERWRAEFPSATGGVVLIWEGEAYGWKSSLRTPGHERPGVYAVDSDGHLFIAEGGSEQDGASCWVVVPQPAG